MPQEPPYEIRSSGIHGRGLFARRLIRKDEWIIEYLGEKIDKQESERRSGLLLDQSRENGSARVFTFVLSDAWDIDGGFDYNDARLVNHSCDPNVEAQVWDEKEIWFVALRDLEPGEELLYNYGFDLDSWREHPCGCGSSRCPGFIADEDLWPQLRRKISAQKAWKTRRRKIALSAIAREPEPARASKAA